MQFRTSLGLLTFSTVTNESLIYAQNTRVAYQVLSLVNKNFFCTTIRLIDAKQIDKHQTNKQRWRGTVLIHSHNKRDIYSDKEYSSLMTASSKPVSANKKPAPICI